MRNAPANAGLAGLPIGLDCQRCGQPITVDYIAHGTSVKGLVSDPMQDIVKAAARMMIIRRGHPQLCTQCNDNG